MGSSPDYWYSGPEVVPDTGPQRARDSTLPEAVDHPGKYYPEVYYPYQPKQEGPYLEGPHPQGTPVQAYNAHEPARDLPEAVPPQEGSKKRICGLASRTFWILLAVVLVVVFGAAIGIGVGVGVSISNRSQSAEGSSAEGSSASDTSPTTTTSPASLGVTSTTTTAGSLSSGTSQTPTTTSAQSTSVTTTEVVGPSSTLFRDCPSSDETVHEVTYGNDTYMFRKFCNTVLLTNGVLDAGATIKTDLDSCVNECARHNYQNSAEIESGETDKWYVVSWRHPLALIFLLVGIEKKGKGNVRSISPLLHVCH